MSDGERELVQRVFAKVIARRRSAAGSRRSSMTSVAESSVEGVRG